jgi:hypothetical protein
MDIQNLQDPGPALPEDWQDFDAEDLPFFDLEPMDLSLDLSGSPGRVEVQGLIPEDIPLPSSPNIAGLVASEQNDMTQNMPMMGQVPVKRRRPKAPEWETMKPLIGDLYIEKNKQFKDVAAALDAKFGFLPS